MLGLSGGEKVVLLIFGRLVVFSLGGGSTWKVAELQTEKQL